MRAPIDGRISDRKVDAGNLVSGGQVGASLLTTIVSLHPIHFVFNVSESDYVRYSRLSASERRPLSNASGSPVQIHLADEKEWIRNGQVNFVDNQLNGKSGTIRARAVHLALLHEVIESMGREYEYVGRFAGQNAVLDDARRSVDGRNLVFGCKLEGRNDVDQRDLHSTRTHELDFSGLDSACDCDGDNNREQKP